MFKFLFTLVRFFRRIIFERGWYVVPPEEEGGYIVPEPWKSEYKKFEEYCKIIRDEELKSLFVKKGYFSKPHKLNKRKKT